MPTLRLEEHDRLTWVPSEEWATPEEELEVGPELYNWFMAAHSAWEEVQTIVNAMLNSRRYMRQDRGVSDA